MAPAPTAATDPPTSVREKGARIVLVFNVANVKANSVQVEVRAPSAEEPAGSVHVCFSSVSPSRSFEKHLVLPHAIDSKTVQDVQSKSLTVQLVKEDDTKEWGQAWLKAKVKAKRKDEAKAGAGLIEETKEAEKPAEWKEVGLVEKEVELVEKEVELVEKEVELVEKEKEVKEELVKDVEEKAEVEPQQEVEVKEEAKAPKEAKAKASKKRTKKAKEAAETPVEEELEVKKEENQVEKDDQKGKAGVKARGKKPKSEGEKGKDEATRTAEKGLEELLQNLKTGPSEHALPAPSDPAINDLVRKGSALLQSDQKKAIVFLRLAGRKGYLPAYLLLAQHAQTTQDDPLFIESLCALFTSDSQKQLPKSLLNTCATQLAAVLRDPKNQQEVTAHADAIDVIAKDWPIMNILKLQSKGAKPKQEAKPKARTAQANFQQIKEAMASQAKTASPGWRRQGSSWCLTVPDIKDASRAELDISSSDLRLAVDGQVLLKLDVPKSLDVSRTEASWFKATSQLEVTGPLL